jgi:hypothetical protein
MRWIGHSLHAEADLDIDGDISVTDATGSRTTPSTGSPTTCPSCAAR